MNNILLVRQPVNSNPRYSKMQPSRRHGYLLPPPLEKYSNSANEDMYNNKTIVNLQAVGNILLENSYSSSHVIHNQIKELQVPSSLFFKILGQKYSCFPVVWSYCNKHLLVFFLTIQSLWFDFLFNHFTRKTIACKIRTNHRELRL